MNSSDHSMVRPRSKASLIGPAGAEKRPRPGIKHPMQIDDALARDIAVREQHEHRDHCAHHPSIAILSRCGGTSPAAAEPPAIDQRHLIREPLETQILSKAIPRARAARPFLPSCPFRLRRHGQEYLLQRAAGGYVLLQFLRTAGGDQLAMMDDADAAAKPLRHLENMGR